jgi:hypothetical protein
MSRTRPTLPPGHPAPASAIYEQLNIFGSSTGIEVHVQQGHPLPDAPLGHSWAITEDKANDC